MPPKLPEPLDEYFAAANVNDSRRAAACFTEDALVYDEGREFRGRDAVRRWVEETGRKYHSKAVVLAVEQVADRTVVTAHVTGEFPGSQIDLHYRFKLADQQIAALDIG